MKTFESRTRRWRWYAALTAAVLPGCAVTQPRAEPRVPDPRSAAIHTVAMHACNLVRAEDPSEADSLHATMAALQILLRDEQVDWGVISATFGEIPKRSRRYLSLSAAMARRYADDAPEYYEGLRHLTTGCLAGLISKAASRGTGSDGRQRPPPRPFGSSSLSRLDAQKLSRHPEPLRVLRSTLGRTPNAESTPRAAAPADLVE